MFNASRKNVDAGLEHVDPQIMFRHHLSQGYFLHIGPKGIGVPDLGYWIEGGDIFI